MTKKSPIKRLTKKQAEKMFHKACMRELRIPGNEFVELWKTGFFNTLFWRHPEKGDDEYELQRKIIKIAMLLPLVRENLHNEEETL